MDILWSALGLKNSNIGHVEAAKIACVPNVKRITLKTWCAQKMIKLTKSSLINISSKKDAGNAPDVISGAKELKMGGATF